MPVQRPGGFLSSLKCATKGQSWSRGCTNCIRSSQGNPSIPVPFLSCSTFLTWLQGSWEKRAGVRCMYVSGPCPRVWLGLVLPGHPHTFKYLDPQFLMNKKKCSSPYEWNIDIDTCSLFQACDWVCEAIRRRWWTFWRRWRWWAIWWRWW